MAKTNSTTAETIPAAPAPAGAPVAAMASGHGKQLPESNTELQRGAESFMSMAESLAGGKPEPEKKPDPKAEAKPAAKPTTPEPKEPAAKAEETIPEEPASQAILGDDDPAPANEHEDEDGAEGGKDAASIEAKLFKQRQKRREAEQQRDAQAAELAAVKKERDELAQKLTAPGAPVLEGYFANVKTEADLAALEQHWDRYREFLEDHEDGYTDEKTGVDHTREQVRAELRTLGKEQAKIPQVRKVFTDRAAQQDAATAKASTLYPFVLNSSKPHNDVALSLAQEFPEINQSPNRALLLGMLTTARLVENKKFTITPALRSKAAEPAPAAPAPVKAAAPMPPSAPPAARVQQAPPDTAAHEHSRMIAGDMSAVEDWAAGLVGE